MHLYELVVGGLQKLRVLGNEYMRSKHCLTSVQGFNHPYWKTSSGSFSFKVRTDQLSYGLFITVLTMNAFAYQLWKFVSGRVIKAVLKVP